jgi:hypothetical protein
MYYIKNLQYRIQRYPVHAILLMSCGILACAFIIKMMNHNPFVDNKMFSLFAKQTWRCFYESDNPYLQAYSKATKSATYIPFISQAENDEYVKKCFITVWHMIHFVGYLLTAFAFPMFWPEILIASAAFELYEYFSCKCHDVSDLVYNSSGILIGVLLRKVIMPI